MKPRLPIGISSFREIREEGYFFADKSALVRLVFEAPAKVILLPRPRRFGECFGFVESDIEQLLTQNGLRPQIPVVRDWYNGYAFGDATIYNPWSILQFANRHPDPPDAYWVNTSSNDLVVQALESAGAQVREQLRQLLAGEELRQPLTDAAVLREGIHAEDLWSFLVAAGYLTADQPRSILDELTYRLRVPNREIRTVFRDVVNRWLRNTVRFDAHRALVMAFVTGDVPEFGRLLQELTLSLLSFYDLAKDKPAEAVFQGFCLGLLAGMGGDWQVAPLSRPFGRPAERRSNREHGLGRADIVLTPKDTSKRAFVIEFKSIPPDGDIEEAIADALNQIETQRYTADLRAAGVADVLELAIVLRGKTVRVQPRSTT